MLTSVSIKIYLSAAHVSTLLTLFGDNSEENSKRIKYCKWKAVTIAKEAKAGGGGAGASGGSGGTSGGAGGEQDDNPNAPPPSYGNNDYNAFNDYDNNASSTGAQLDRQPSAEVEKKSEEDDEANIDFG